MVHLFWYGVMLLMGWTLYCSEEAPARGVRTDLTEDGTVFTGGC